MSIWLHYLTSVIIVLIAVCVCANPAQKDGNLDDFRRLASAKNIAANAFELPVSLDASNLEETIHYSRHSETIELKADTRYTLGITYRATGPSLVSTGMKWQIPDEPAGLVDTDSIRARWPQSDDWTLRVLTFRSDHEYTIVQIIIKAYGGMSLQVKDVALVEGWYSD